MNDQLHHLLDGELPDGATAEYLRHLSEDAADRTTFRQQMKLHGALYRNAGHDTMTSGEVGEMLERLQKATGGATGAVPRGMWRRGVAVATIIGATLVGGGLGFFAHDTLVPRVSEITVAPISPRVTLQIRPAVVAPDVASTGVRDRTISKTSAVRRSTAHRSVRGKRTPQAVAGLPSAKR